MAGAVVGLGGLVLLGVLRYRSLHATLPAVSDAVLMQAVVAHERAKGNAITEADVIVTKPVVVDLPRGTFAVFATPQEAGTQRIALDGGDRAGSVTLARLAPRSLPNSGLGAGWAGRLTVRLTGASAAHLAFFSDPGVAVPSRPVLP